MSTRGRSREDPVTACSPTRTWLMALAGFVALAVAAVLLPAGAAAAERAAAGHPPAAFTACPEDGPDVPIEEAGCGIFVRDPWGAERRLTDNWEDQGPAWSPDGREIAYVRRDRGLFVVGADGTGHRQVSGDVAASAAWSPDGRFVAFLRSEGGTGFPNELAIVPADGSEGRVLLPRSGSFSWAPNGRRLAAVRSGADDQPDELVIVTLDGEVERAIAPAEPEVGRVAWSPDGTRLAYSATDLAEGRFSNSRGYVVGVDGTGTRRVGGEDARPSAHSWSPDGSRLALQEKVDQSTTHTTFEIDVVDVETGQLLAELAFEQRTLQRPVWSIDGTRLHLNARADPLQGAPGDVGPWLMVTDLQGNFRDLHEGANTYVVGPEVGFCPQVAWYDVDRAPLTDRSAIPAAHRANVDCAVHHGIVRGFGDDTYRPARDVRRDQMASFVVGALEAAGVELTDAGDERFTDVPEDSPHAAAIRKLAGAGVVQGGPGRLSGDRYGPELVVRRDQMASFLVRAVQFATGEEWTSQTQRFSDVPPNNAHFATVNGAAENGLAAGHGDGTFRPDAGVRRDQTATFAVRLLTAPTGAQG